MATRVKKQGTAATSKELVPPQTTSKNEAPSLMGRPPNPVGSGGIGKKLGRKPGIKNLGVKKTVPLKAKTKVGKKSLKINPKNFARVLMENGKALEGKKLILKNGSKEVVKKPRKPRVPKVKKEPLEEEPPPVLEPIFPQEENVELKKTPKKRGRKPGWNLVPNLVSKIKVEPLDESVGTSYSMVEEVSTPIEAPIIMKKKPGRKPKPKQESSIDEVMTDLSYLIESDQIKKEVDDGASDSTSSKPVKKLTKKQKIDLIKNDFNKKENIENTLSKLDPAASKVIDRLDLNVRKFKTELPRVKRRHSIEKFPVGSVDSSGDGLVSQLSIFNQLPRSLSPKISKRGMRMGGGKRGSPYSTRSDSPARMLRNGKHRRLKDMALLDGLEGPKRRKRVHSDLSGSETASKLSGYESDSSFSDLASLHGSEKDSDLSKSGIKDVDSLLMDDSSNQESKIILPPDDILKGNSSSDVDKPLIDTNSNLCGDSMANDMELEGKPELLSKEDAPSYKVPEKGLLLDIMKQTFNDMNAEKPKCEANKFHGRSMEQGHELHQGRRNSVTNQEMSDAATSTGDLCQRSVSETEVEMSEVEELRQLLAETDEEFDKTKNTEEFPIEDKEAEEEASLEHIVQGCIDSIENVSPEAVGLPVLQQVINETFMDDVAPVLEKQVVTHDPEKDDSLPIIDNMSSAISHPPQNQEHLDPPLLESSVLIPEPINNQLIDQNPVVNNQKQSVIDDHNIGIAVTEKDNVVLFSIEHLSDEAEESEINMNEKNECVDHILEEKTSQDEEGLTKKDGELIPEEPCEAEGEIEAPNKTEALPIDSSKTEQNIPINVELANISVASMEPLELSMEEQQEEHEPPILEKMESDQSDNNIVDEVKEVEKECDKPSETTEVEKQDSVEDKKQVEVVKESPEELAQKENILNALGLQSLHATKEPSQPKKKSKPSTSKGDGYTGTLKTVIKINKKKGGKNSFKMTLQKNKNKSDGDNSGGEEGYKIMKEAGSSSWKHSKESSDTAGAHRKSHYSNRSNMDGSSEHTSDGEQAGTSHDKSQPEKSLIVPEKASSFSIHPGRLCKDECSYCFGKFGLFDTPCHIAQMKSVERQNKILEAEKHLTRDSCLCDACYRHVDRKSNSPSYINKSLKRNSLVAPGPRQNHCHVLGCNNVSTNILRRKWIIKMRKSICQVINIDLDNPGLHSIPICDEHFSALEHLMICAMCKRRLARNHIHYLGPEVNELNEALKDEEIPILLSDKPVVCKLCKCFVSIILKDPEERMDNSINFFKEYKKRLLHFNDIVHMDNDAAEEPLIAPSKSDKSGEFGKKRKRIRNSSNESHSDKEDHEDESEAGTRPRVPSTDTNNSQSANQSRAQSPEDEYGGVDYNTLIPAIAMDCPSDGENKKDVASKRAEARKMPRLESFGNSSIEITRTFKTDRNRSNDLAAQKLGQNPSISLRPNYGGTSSNDSWQNESPSKLMSNPALSVRQLFPGEEELGLVGDIDFKNTSTRTAEGWEKCTATIQYDEETKLLWQELQKPYGSKSSFLRHLILLEKYFRNGDLILSQTASHHATNYRESVHNRLRAYDNIPSSAGSIQPPSMIQFNKMQGRSSGGGITMQNSSNGLPPVTISQVGRGDNENQLSKTPITLQQLSQPPLYPGNTMLQNLTSKNRSSVAPPGLISINQRATAPGLVRSQIPSQKIKFPITKNWRPNLIPIDPAKRHERKPGLVQVISGGKPYHITLEDYKKMCAIKRSFEAKQKKIQEQQALAKQQQGIVVSHNSVLKTVIPKKGLVISKTSGGSLIENKPVSLVPISATITSDSSETILEKLDKQVERLGQIPDASTLSAIALEKNPAIQIIPRIPKSLTVVQQTVRKSGPPSPVLCITPRGSSSNSSNNDSGQP